MKKKTKKTKKKKKKKRRHEKKKRDRRPPRLPPPPPRQDWICLRWYPPHHYPPPLLLLRRRRRCILLLLLVSLPPTDRRRFHRRLGWGILREGIPTLFFPLLAGSHERILHRPLFPTPPVGRAVGSHRVFRLTPHPYGTLPPHLPGRPPRELATEKEGTACRHGRATA